MHVGGWGFHCRLALGSVVLGKNLLLPASRSESFLKLKAFEDFTPSGHFLRFFFDDLIFVLD
jgi:hypothetical protein